jgi:hypothetical protein
MRDAESIQRLFAHWVTAAEAKRELKRAKEFKEWLKKKYLK